MLLQVSGRINANYVQNRFQDRNIFVFMLKHIQGIEITFVPCVIKDFIKGLL